MFGVVRTWYLPLGSRRVRIGRIFGHQIKCLSPTTALNPRKVPVTPFSRRIIRRLHDARRSLFTASGCRPLTIHQSTNQSINQSINLSVNQSIYQSINLSVNQSINQSIIQSTAQPTDQNQFIDRSHHQSINRTYEVQSTNQPVYHHCVE